MASNTSKTPAVIIPLIQTVIASKLTWGESSFTYIPFQGEKEHTVEAKRFVSAHRIDAERIALTFMVRFTWREPENANKTSVNDWLDRWERPGKPPVFMRKPRIRKR